MKISSPAATAFLLLLSSSAFAFAPSNKVQRAAAVLIESSTIQPFARGWVTKEHNSAMRLDATVVESESTTTNATIVAKATAVNGEIQSTVVSSTSVPASSSKGGTIELMDQEAKLLQEMEAQAEAIVDGMLDETCLVDEETGGPADELCVDEEKRKGFRATVKGYVKSIGSLVVGRSKEEDVVAPGTPAKRLTGDQLEKGCE